MVFNIINGAVYSGTQIVCSYIEGITEDRLYTLYGEDILIMS
jgi:hypothetical protein